MIHSYRINTPQFILLLFVFLLFIASTSVGAQGFEGYYRYPALHKDKIVFTAEGDLWTSSLSGGLAQRLTTHAEQETFASISPDGKTVAYSARYEGPREVYTIPITGGLPIRCTYESDVSIVNSWTPDGKILYDTRHYATLPDRQLVSIDLNSNVKTRIPLSQASEATYDTGTKTYFFVRPSFHGNVTKRYKGGTARQIWKYTEGTGEAIKLTTGYSGGSHHPSFSNNRIYHITDRDGTMNIWSIDTYGNDLRQHTEHTEFDVRNISVYENNIVYQVGADLYHYEISTDLYKKINIRLSSDLPQLQEKWEENPAKYITSVHPDKSGDKLVITARGRIFVMPVKNGRITSFSNKDNVRYRDAVFTPGDSSIYTLSDESGEFEFISLPANGIGESKKITTNGKILRYKGVPSSDGKWLAFDDLQSNLYITNVSTGATKKISTNEEGIYTFSWSPDNKWLAFVQVANNTMAQVFLYNVDTDDTFPITTDRANSFSPQWSPDGDFIYMISDRSFTTLVGSPWGPRQPEPYFDAKEKIYHIALQKKKRSPFRYSNELYEKEKTNKSDTVIVKIDKEGILERIKEVPVPAGNYRSLSVNDKTIFYVSRTTGINSKTNLNAVSISNDKLKPKIIVDGIRNYELTQDGKKLMIVKNGSYYIVKAGSSKISNLSDAKVNFKNWKFPINPVADWKQIFTDAWRMERDYFYDKNMHGVNWKAMHDKYYPLVDRVTTRFELSDLIGRFVGELSALHTSVGGGDINEDKSDISIGNLGARLKRDQQKGGYVIEHIYKADPDYPNQKSPLDDPYLDIENGDVILSVNGIPTLSVSDIGSLLRNQVGKQVRLNIKDGIATRDVIVLPIGREYALKYNDWEYSRRLEVESKSENKIGYVHLQAMGGRDLNQWYREFYPVFDRPGLIIDVRHNRGGNIESFILEKLLRKAWMYWKSRSGKPYWNMQYAFRGHIVILVDQNTASDGEAFADGFKKLNLGTAIGTRTWGGEIWLHSANRLSDNGIARAPMMGVYGEDGTWLIEGHGFEPDIEVDNMPHATFNGQDAQLEAAVNHLKKLIKEDPREVPAVPAYPDKSFMNNK